MDILYAPWRMAYIREKRRDEGCVFCKAARAEDLVVWEAKRVVVWMNAFPYVSGHLMVVPRRHVGQIERLTKAERMEIFHGVDVCIRALKEAMEPHGFNIGMNLGRAAGAGVEDHLHVHVVPRWGGDTNFMGVIGGTRVIPEDVPATCRLLRPYFDRHQEV